MGLAKWGAVLAFLLLATAWPAAAAESVETDLKWLERLAKAGDAEAWYRIGVIKERGIGLAVDPPGAVAAYGEAAELGHAKAQFRLAQLLAAGFVPPPDHVGARRWYEAAAVQGIAEAAYNAGLYAETGLGGAEDMRSAAAYFRQAAKAGLPQAAERLALLHLDGRLDGASDPVAALAWLLLAERLGSRDAGILARLLGEEMTAEQRAEAAALAAQL